MASSSSRNGEHRSIHQDFIARIRYSNALPPPPHPPKLLDIPNTGLASGQYTAPSFASRLAREQPLNIEADAELGMPLDLVGMPGIFDGDESSIQAPAQPAPPHPHDRALLRPLSTLGKPKVADPSVSFLRRTEYISSVTSKARQEAGPLRNLNTAPRRPLKRPSPEPDKDSPAYVKRKIDQSFAIAAANLKDKNRVKHPSKRNAKLLDVYPLIPDLDAFPDSGAYVTVKFTNNPVPPSKTYDTRLLHGLFRPIEKSDAEEEAYQLALQAHERDPQNIPKPAPAMNYDFYLNDSADTADKFRKRFDVDNPDHDDDSLYTHRDKDGRPNFQFTRVRAYETAQETELNHDSKYDDEVIIAFNDDTMDQKAAYYYPVMQRTTIRPQRTKNIARTIGIAEMEEQVVHQLDVTVGEPDYQLKQVMESFKERPYGPEEDEDDAAAAATDEPSQSQQQQQRDGSADADADAAANGGSPARQRSPEEDEDQDAEGDDED
ncbi:hypothetical protein DL771_008647 [Monosporascus sp. 5C6A]|nr:hypothetical protein DL771_008647 [Monosporascus sp. 5C6A]